MSTPRFVLCLVVGWLLYVLLFVYVLVPVAKLQPVGGVTPTPTRVDGTAHGG